ncbi:glycoside hydrolase family 5 protein [Butyrivibrio sp. XPD2006]|uniref:glycoside hydrolase family 5 protein n=1 Tax=Butyrivibrio sp. XPD2006 TaxID=1280668 RepID=UPI0003B33588|nr:glycoside hydrolase family 5 protein [Butyrivibrio sp. XPD2006]
MKKNLIAVVAYLLGIITAFSIMDYRYSIGKRYYLEENPLEDEMSIELLSKSPLDDLEEVYAHLGQGFNIGNALDVCDWTYFGSSHNPGFQAAIVYNTEPWSAWDVSDYVSFNNKGLATITWKMSGINSSDSAKADNLALQLVNHNKTYDKTDVTCTVKKLELKKADGKTYDISTDNLNDYQLTVEDDVTDYVYFDLSQFDITTSSLRDATLTAELEISDYFMDIEGEIASLERFWGNPETNEEMIKAIKAAGFDTVRVPVTYFNHISEGGTIDKEFLDRVEEVVDWVLDNEMYCIIDVHNDSGNAGWIKASAENYEKNHEMVAYIFRQIAERFKDKDHHLVFEGLNEVVNDKNQWDNIPASDIKIMNEWNQLFVDTVRTTGANNEDRFLLVNTYAALPTEECLKNFVIPSDSVNNRILVGIHCYFKLKNIENSYAVISKYSSKYHLVISEWGYDKSIPDRLSTIKVFMSEADKRNIPTIYWDNGNPDVMGILNRNTCEWEFGDIVGAIIGK